MSEPPYGSLEWQKQKLVAWLMDLWLRIVPLDHSQVWLQRQSMNVSEQQWLQTIQAMESMSDGEFGAWLLDDAQLWQQLLMAGALRNLQLAIESAQAGDPLIVACALQIRDRDSLRKVLLGVLRSYHRP